MSRIDLHTHILPERWPSWTRRTGYAGWIELAHHTPGCARMEQTLPDGSRKSFRDIAANCWDPALRLREMDSARIDLQVLSTVPVMFSSWAKPHDALDLHRLLNDHIAEVARAHPRRFASLACVPLQDPDLACRELERCVNSLDFRGVQIATHVNGQNLDEPALFPFFQTAARLNAAVFVHPWDMLAPERTARYWMPWLVGMPTETTIAITSVLFSGLLDKLPTLRIGFAHGGGSFPGTLGRIAHGFAARPDLFPPDAHPPHHYLANPATNTPARFWVDSLTHEPHALRTLLRVMHPRRVALGSDYPFPLGEALPGSLIDTMPELDAPTRAHLFSGAAAEFLALAPGSFA